MLKKLNKDSFVIYLLDDGIKMKVKIQNLSVGVQSVGIKYVLFTNQKLDHNTLNF